MKDNDILVPKKATDHLTLLEQLMDYTVPKSEREWVAVREIECLKGQLLEYKKNPIL